MSKLNQTVWIIQGGRVVETTYADLIGYIDTTTRPTGVGPSHYVCQDDDGRWCVAHWVTSNGPEHIFGRYDSEADAVATIEAIWIDQIQHSDEVVVYSHKALAEAVLAEIDD